MLHLILILHSTKKSNCKLSNVRETALEGKLDPVIEACIAEDQRQKLQTLV